MSTTRNPSGFIRREVQLMVIPLRDCQNVLLLNREGEVQVQHVYGMAFDDEPVVMVLMAA